MEAEKKSRNLIFGTTTSILVGLLGILSWQFVEQKDAAEQAQFQLNELTELTRKDSLVYKFNMLKFEYKAVSTKNIELKSALKGQSKKIAQLIGEIDILQHSSNDSKLDLAYLKLAELEKVGESYTSKIDRLTKEKADLLAENKTLKNNLVNEKKYSKLLEEKIEAPVIAKATEKLKVTELLKINDFNAIPITYNFEGKEAISKKASRTKKIRVCFTTEKNSLVTKGRKTAFINIYSPSGTLIAKTGNASYNGGNAYTMKQVFSYQNTEKDICSYWFATKEYLPGEYKTELIINSQILSTHSFSLK